MKLQRFLMDSKDIEKDSFIWNLAGSLLQAFQSVIILTALTRILNLNDAGIFTIAYANANLFLTIGKYGMRYFQVSDVKDQFTFEEYRYSRTITTVAMVIISLAYVICAGWKNSYSLGKVFVIFWMCCFKAVDSIEDIYHGFCQQKGRLDVAAKAMTLRMIITILVFLLCIIFLKNLLFSLVISTLLSALLLAVLMNCISEIWKQAKGTIELGNVALLLKICFPLFAGSFLSFYIGNAPKYAIDAALSDELQACYGFIAMPVFVIELLNGFIFNPLIHRLSILWERKKYKEFLWRLCGQSVIIAAITVGCMLAAWVAGIPVLSWLYNTDLSAYRGELLILLLGGGFRGLSGFLCTVITIIRFQKHVLWWYLGVAAVAFLLSGRAVALYGIWGASVLYMILMGMLSVAFAGVTAVGIYRGKKSKKR